MRHRIAAAAARTAPYLLGAVSITVLLTAVTVFVQSRGYGYDFAAYDAAARRIVAGSNVYLPGTAAAYNAGAESGLYLYPPPVAMAFLPFTILDPASAVFIWLVGRAALLVVACAILPVRPLVRMSVLAAGVCSFPVLFDLNLGNVSIVLFILAALGWRTLDRPAASVIAAASIFVRPPLALLPVWWLLRGRVAQATWVVIAGAVMAAATLAVIGIGPFADYVALVTGLHDLASNPHNLSLGTTASAIGLSDQISRFATVAGYGLALVVVLVVARYRDAEAGFVVTMMASLLLSPFFHPHYLVMLLLPAALLADRGWLWAAAIPLLGWLPGPLLPLVVIGATLLPLVAPLREPRAGQPRAAPHGAGLATSR